MKKKSRETDSRSGDKQHFVWDLKVHHLVHKRLLHNPALSQLNPTHNLRPPPLPRYITMSFSHMVPFVPGFRMKLRLLFPHKYSHLTHPDLITSKYLVRTNHDATHSTIINTFQFHSLSPVHTFPSSLCIQTPTIDEAVYRSRYC
jgi:hypothetical protein